MTNTSQEAEYYLWEQERKIFDVPKTKCEKAGQHSWKEMKNTREGWSLCVDCGRVTMNPKFWDEKISSS